jgi:hypothetical protein
MHFTERVDMTTFSGYLWRIVRWIDILLWTSTYLDLSRMDCIYLGQKVRHGITFRCSFLTPCSLENLWQVNVAPCEIRLMCQLPPVVRYMVVALLLFCVVFAHQYLGC